MWQEKNRCWWKWLEALSRWNSDSNLSPTDRDVMQKSCLVVQYCGRPRKLQPTLPHWGDFLAGCDHMQAAQWAWACVQSHVQFTCIRQDFNRPVRKSNMESPDTHTAGKCQQSGHPKSNTRSVRAKKHGPSSRWFVFFKRKDFTTWMHWSFWPGLLRVGLCGLLGSNGESVSLWGHKVTDWGNNKDSL